MAAVALAGTLDTKGPDFAFLADRPAEVETFSLDWGTMKRTLRLLVTYTPGGEEQALTALPGFTATRPARSSAGDVPRRAAGKTAGPRVRHS